MSWIICGSVPDADFPLSLSTWHMEQGRLHADGTAHLPQGGVLPELSVQRGTPALIAATLQVCQSLHGPRPLALLVGDTGSGAGSLALYDFLADWLATTTELLHGLTFHYLFPHVDGHNRILMSYKSYAGQHPAPTLVADAGFMYAAKMSGYASEYDLFAPDAGELAFLADENAPHPFYTRGFLLDNGLSTQELVQRAQTHDNCARTLLIKGAVDTVAEGGEVVATVDSPNIPFMEPIGGTGDLVTGIVTGLLMAGWPLRQACVAAAKTNRLAGELAAPTPATQVGELIPFLPAALRQALQQLSFTDKNSQ